MSYASPRVHRRARLAGAAVRLAIVPLVLATLHTVVTAAGSPVRAYWVPSSALSSPVAVRRAVSAALSGGFAAVAVPLSVARQEDHPLDYDGEADIIRQARDSGLSTHLAVSVNAVAGVDEWPASREHVIYQHPEWLMVPRSLAAELLTLDTRSPAYLGRLARWIRANTDRVDGLYLSPLDPSAAAHLVNVVVSAARRYSPDGIFLDNVDFPGTDFDYSRRAVDLFRTRMRSTLSPSERARLDEVEAIDPFAYPEEFPDEWRQFRESALTGLLERLRAWLSAASSSASIAVSIQPDVDVSRRDRFQDWRSWLDRGLIDRVGYRDRTAGSVVLTPDGGTLVDPASRRAQATTVGGSR
jgi:uncharacterized lipoprotein YddW (UPF0748 family)